MQEVFRILIGSGVLALGFPLGLLLAELTKEELKAGQNWFKLIILISCIGAVVFLILRNDAFFFTCSFIAIVTSGSLKKSNKKKNAKSSQ